MDFLIDKPETEKDFQQLLHLIKLQKNGDVVASMKGQGIIYKINWGVSVVELRRMAREFVPDHLLALKLWNKQWRETMILATLLEVPGEVTEQQMDYWTKTFETMEIAEQASANLWVNTKFAFTKSLEWCRGKKHLVRFTGIHLMGRLAIVQKDAIDEMFEPFFDELAVLAKDSRLSTVIYRSVLALGSRSQMLKSQITELAKTLLVQDHQDAAKLGKLLLEELTADFNEGYENRY